MGSYYEVFGELARSQVFLLELLLGPTMRFSGKPGLPMLNYENLQ